jgi:hypothetical protein
MSVSIPDFPSFEAAVDEQTISLATFLETAPPSQGRAVQSEFEAVRIGGPSPHVRINVDWPDIQIHCTHQDCNGVRFHRPETARLAITLNATWSKAFIVYTCSNCQKNTKLFALFARATRSAGEGKIAVSLEMSKIGEHPPFGPITPARLISLIGGDRDIFLKGRRCENQGLGIGAFAYYRRVVENQKSRILDNIIAAAEKTRATPEMITALRSAKDEQQFKKAVEDVKDAIPESLLIDGHNPLTLLHSALSDGLHARTDEECLELAQAIRLVLADLAERISQALKDDRELKEGISRLLNRGAKDEPHSVDLIEEP